MKELDNIPKSKFTIVKTEEKILDVAWFYAFDGFVCPTYEKLRFV